MRFRVLQGDSVWRGEVWARADGQEVRDGID